MRLKLTKEQAKQFAEDRIRMYGNDWRGIPKATDLERQIFLDNIEYEKNVPNPWRASK